MGSYASRGMFLPSRHLDLWSTQSLSSPLIRMDDSEWSLIHPNSCYVHPHRTLSYLSADASKASSLMQYCQWIIEEKCVTVRLQTWRPGGGKRWASIHSLDLQRWGDIFFKSRGFFPHLYWDLWLSKWQKTELNEMDFWCATSALWDGSQQPHSKDHHLNLTD